MCFIIKMTHLIDAIKPYNRWDHSSIRPGPVGSVGDVLITPRLKSSLPGNFNWDAEYYGNKESLYGSSVSDGSYVSFNSGGGPARTLDSNWGMRRRFRTMHGWYYQDLRAPDKNVEPEMGSLPQYNWRNRIATVNNAKSTGDLFMPLPTVELPTDGLPRGGLFPRVTDVIGGAEDAGFDGNDTVNAGPPLLNPNFHPHLSSNTSFRNNPREEVDMNRRQGKAGVSGRMYR